MEPVAVSRQYATILLDAALEQCAWTLAKDLIRFLRAIDPSDVELEATAGDVGHPAAGGSNPPTPPPSLFSSLFYWVLPGFVIELNPT